MFLYFVMIIVLVSVRIGYSMRLGSVRLLISLRACLAMFLRSVSRPRNTF